MEEKMIDKIRRYFIYFMLYSMIGWIYEVFLEVVIYKWGFSNRGFLFGPYCVVYGFGALAFILSLRKIKESEKFKYIAPVFVAIGIILIATAMELVASYLMEWTIGSWQWDYTSYIYNFEGRVALNPSLRFGLGGMIFMYVLQPLFEKLTKKLGTKKTNVIANVLGIILIIDIICTIISYIH